MKATALFVILAAILVACVATYAGKNSIEHIPGDVFRDCPTCPEMVVVPAGLFHMGDASGKGKSNEKPSRNVLISSAFAVSRFEVTQAEWKAVMGRAVWWRYHGDDHPADWVTWEDAKRFVKRLTKITGKRYRLLTEAEWEYVARAGNESAFPFEPGENFKNLCEYGNVRDHSFIRYDNTSIFADCDDGYIKIAPVGQFKPNQFGVYDMIGNVPEWVEDCWHKDYRNAPVDGSARKPKENCQIRVVRGGSYNSEPMTVRPSNRDSWTASSATPHTGIRLARDLEGSNQTQTLVFNIDW